MAVPLVRQDEGGRQGSAWAVLKAGECVRARGLSWLRAPGLDGGREVHWCGVGECTLGGKHWGRGTMWHWVPGSGGQRNLWAHLHPREPGR